MIGINEPSVSSEVHRDGHLRPYSPSWLDRLTTTVLAWPVPWWLSYLILYVVVASIANFIDWNTGWSEAGSFTLIQPVLLWGIFAPAAITYLNGAARDALAGYRPVLSESEDGYAALEYQFTVLPARSIWWLTLLSGAFAIVGLYLFREMVSDYFPLWQLWITVLIAPFVLGALYHTCRQLWLVSQMHRRLQGINLFHLQPVYAFSGLSMRVALIWLLPVLMSYASVPQELMLSPSKLVGMTVLAAALIFTAFVVPLWGIHRYLVQEKGQYLASVNERLQHSLECLYNCVDDRNSPAAEQENKIIASLLLARNTIQDIPTWPWQPGTIRNLLGALTIPLGIWLMQRLLERFLP